MIQSFSQIPGTFLGYCCVLGCKLAKFIVVWSNTCKFNYLRCFCWIGY